jgi:hypothetical protein
MVGNIKNIKMKLFREILYISFQFVYFFIVSVPLCVLLLIGTYLFYKIKRADKKPAQGQTIQK